MSFATEESEGKFKTLTHTTFSFDDVRKAHEMMESASHLGKILLTT